MEMITFFGIGLLITSLGFFINKMLILANRNDLSVIGIIFMNVGILILMINMLTFTGTILESPEEIFGDEILEYPNLTKYMGLGFTLLGMLICLSFIFIYFQLSQNIFIKYLKSGGRLNYE